MGEMSVDDDIYENIFLIGMLVSSQHNFLQQD
jgi:hypothetical protein